MNTTQLPAPIEVEVRKANQTMHITWDDGHSSAYGLSYLRGYCPCAACQGHGGDWNYVQHEPTPLVEIREVGAYALGLIWGDGHNTGIYSYEILRTLCPCGQCVHDSGTSHPLQRMDSGEPKAPPPHGAD